MPLYGCPCSHVPADPFGRALLRAEVLKVAMVAEPTASRPYVEARQTGLFSSRLCPKATMVGCGTYMHAAQQLHIRLVGGHQLLQNTPGSNCSSRAGQVAAAVDAESWRDYKCALPSGPMQSWNIRWKSMTSLQRLTIKQCCKPLLLLQ
eukprot:1140082-Pelagomonas_calceolata.AAC.2